MHFKSVLFHRIEASQWSVGKALHAQPPSMVERSGFALSIGGAHPDGSLPLATRAHMEQLCKYDIQMMNWRRVFKTLNALPDDDHTVDWTEGSQVPW